MRGNDEEPDPRLNFTRSAISHKAKRPPHNDVGTGVQYPAWELMARGTTLLHRRDWLSDSGVRHARCAQRSTCSYPRPANVGRPRRSLLSRMPLCGAAPSASKTKDFGARLGRDFQRATCASALTMRFGKTAAPRRTRCAGCLPRTRLRLSLWL